MTIVGHRRQRELLSIMAASGEIPHAMIFEGPSKLGKRTTAVEFVGKLFCETGDGCGSCRPCSDLAKGSHPDLTMVVAEGREIQISQIRSLAGRFSLKPYSAPIKAAIIDDAHLMNRESQNSILKLLEEPGGDSVMILVTDHPEILLQTVRSRSRRITFFPIGEGEIESFLRERGCKDTSIEEIRLFSFGRPGLAVDFLSDPTAIATRKERVEGLLSVISADAPFRKRMEHAKELAEDPVKTEEALETWLSYFRALMIKKVESGHPLSGVKRSLEAIDSSIDLVSRTNANKRMVLERLIMEL